MKYFNSIFFSTCLLFLIAGVSVPAITKIIERSNTDNQKQKTSKLGVINLPEEMGFTYPGDTLVMIQTNKGYQIRLYKSGSKVNSKFLFVVE